ncbi:exported hypothetical protein [Thiocapsa sp. KS1]|nr:hypothetical protein [Thiocapsa sp. KS1]CRI63025.1 exported hypothetical protein [Thiocapsa sp. KS1]
MPHDRSRRDFLKKATYVPPILLSFHAAPSFARPGSVPAGPSQPGIQTLKPDVQAMNPTIASSAEPAANPGSADRGAGRGSSSGLDLPEYGTAASTGGVDACEPVDDRRYGLSSSAAAKSRDAGNRGPRVTVGSCSDETVVRPGADALREISSRLWKSGG